jgi:hypothetical protein
MTPFLLNDEAYTRNVLLREHWHRELTAARAENARLRATLADIAERSNDPWARAVAGRG